MIRRYPLHTLLVLILLAVWWLLSYYNVLVDDDLVFLKLVQEKGNIGATLYQYDTWNTRWMSFLWLHAWMQFWTPESSLLPYHLATLTALVMVSFRCIRAMQHVNWIKQGSLDDSFFMATLLALAVVVGTYHIGDTWFWVNTSTMYGWNLIFILWAGSLVIRPDRHAWLNSTALVLCGLYTGGSSEPAVASLVVLIVALLLKGKLTSGQRQSLLTFLIAMMVAFLIAYLGDGHAKREEALPDAGLVRWAGLSGWYFIRIIAIESPIRILIILALLWPLRKSPELSKNLSIRMTAPLVWLVNIAIHAGLIVAIMGDYGPPRALSFIGLVSVFGVLAIMSQIETVWLKGLAGAGLLTALVVGGWKLTHQVRELPEYRKHVIKVNRGERQFKPEDVPGSGLLHRITFSE